MKRFINKKAIIVILIVILLLIVSLIVRRFIIINSIMEKSSIYKQKENVYHKIIATDSNLSYVEVYNINENQKIALENKDNGVKITQYIIDNVSKSYYDMPNGEKIVKESEEKIFPLEKVTSYFSFNNKFDMFLSSIFANIKNVELNDKEYYIIKNIKTSGVNNIVTGTDLKETYYINKETGLVEKVTMKNKDGRENTIIHEYKFDTVSDVDLDILDIN